MEFTIEYLAAAIRDGSTSAVAVAEEVLERCARFRQLNAVISQAPERLLEAARLADRQLAAGIDPGPLHGVPIFIKDNIDTRDYPTSAGTPALEKDYPRYDATVVRRLLDAGALIAGKTNLHELAVGGSSTNLYYGFVRSTWRDDVIAGGSSGGSAAAVSARLAPAALGTDTNGSVRGPCSLSGIVGFRPGFRRYPGDGVIPPTPTRDSVGIMANSVADLVILDGVLSGDAHAAVEIPLDGVRFGRPRGDLYKIMDQRTARIMDAAVALLQDQGAVIIDADIPGLTQLTAKVAWAISAYEVVREMPVYMQHRGTEISVDEIREKIASPVVKQRFTPFTDDMNALEVRYKEAMEVHRPRLQQTINDYFAEHALDAIVLPTTPFPAPPMGDDTSDLMINGELLRGGFSSVIQNTVFQSAAGIPSLVVPAGVTDDGLPVGISFDGLQGSDRALLAMGHAFEQARGPFPRPPACADTDADR